MDRSIHVPWHAGGWSYLCLADALAADSCHATIDLPALSITAQNFRGMIAAFVNVCSHRCIQMRAPGLGRGSLRCPYHGWAYDAVGVPAGIPDNDSFYGLDRAARRALALKPAVVHRCGGLLFVAAIGAAPLGEFLGAAFESLAAVEIAEAWTVARFRTRGAPAQGREGLSLDLHDGWCLIRSRVALGDGLHDSTVQLLHAGRRPVTEAPPAFRQALADHESRHLPADS
jgi:nitrite reductase/ring-hydroxylating ferredoxin subunit